MTKEEAIVKVRKCGYGDAIVDALEALGLIKFEAEEDKLLYNVFLPSQFMCNVDTNKWGTIRVCEYEGKLHFWVGGKRRCTLNKDDM